MDCDRNQQILSLCEAMLDKTEFDAIDDEEDCPCEEPEPFLRHLRRHRRVPQARAGLAALRATRGRTRLE